MRKYIRKILRFEARSKKVKESKYIKEKFESIQNKKLGVKRRSIYKAIGTHPRRVWKSRISMLS